MLKLIELLLRKSLGKTKGYLCNLTDWDSETIGEKLFRHQPLNMQEQYAMAFFGDIGNVLDVWDPPEKWEKPTGAILNETRKLH